MTRGQIPTDSRYYLYVLSIGELLALSGKYFGRGGEDLLAAYETVARDAVGSLSLLHLGTLQVRATEARDARP